MKSLHYFDVIGQSLIIILYIGGMILEDDHSYLILIYIGLGIWQPIFTLIHSIADYRLTALRKYYNYSLLVMAGLGILMPIIYTQNEEYAYQIGNLLMIISLGLALYNYILSIKEVISFNKPHLI